ncbi:hypothetical protein KR054_005798 [Drosophila jambulina]|nr:hypothetical protein KR054_005798 [Drosophila jambulina]
MRPSKFVVYCLLYFLHTAPRQVQGEEIIPEDLILDKDSGGDNGTSLSDFHYLVTGGYRPAKNDLVKFAVSMRIGEPYFFGTNHMCGGSIISKRAVLTAAHCMYSRRGSLYQARRLRVYAGTPKRLERAPTTQEMQVKRVVPHPKYRSGRYRHDLGILLLKGEFSTNDKVAIIPLNDKKTSGGLKCTVVGWGTVVQFGPSADEVINGDVQILPKSECEQLDNFNAKGMICAKDREDSEVDSCQGDSGGPLICNTLLTGIVSFGEGCGEKHSAGVYTDVYYYYDWIKENSAPYQQRVSLVSLVFQVSLALTLPLLLPA